MRHRFTFTVALIVLLTLSGSAEAATLAQLRAAIDAFIETRWPTIVARQENYRANRGVYWQGLRTHSSCPVHTNSTDGSISPDRLDATPDDAFSSWRTVFPEWAEESLAACFWVDVYSGPTGQGWVLHVEATYNGTRWQRSVNVGPESYRSHPWTAVVPFP